MIIVSFFYEKIYKTTSEKPISLNSLIFDEALKILVNASPHKENK